MKPATECKHELHQKAEVLKQYEVYCYQIAYFILEKEALAMQAATQSLMELVQDEQFFLQSQTVQRQMTKKVVMKQSLLTKAKALQCTV
ncbi:MAG: hypothetical protein ACE3L7_22350 [Candidatus Pristimantibacillus sp.]